MKNNCLPIHCASGWSTHSTPTRWTWPVEWALWSAMRLAGYLSSAQHTVSEIFNLLVWLTYRNLCSDRYFFLGSENCSQKWDILFNTGSVCKLLQTHYCYQTNNFDSGLQTTPTATVDNSLIGPKNPVMMCLVKSMQWRGGQTVMDLTSVTSFFSYSIIAPDGLVGSISSASPTPTAFPVGVVSILYIDTGCTQFSRDILGS